MAALGTRTGIWSAGGPGGLDGTTGSAGRVLEAADFLDAGSLLETAAWLRQQFREEADEISVAGGAVRLACGFQGTAGGHPAMHSAEWRDQ